MYSESPFLKTYYLIKVRHLQDLEKLAWMVITIQEHAIIHSNAIAKGAPGTELPVPLAINGFDDLPAPGRAVGVAGRAARGVSALWGGMHSLFHLNCIL